MTITSVGGQQLDNFQLDQPQEIAERIPNFNIQTGGSGSGGTLNLRGVGSSAISAAFDSAVALDIDGVQIARMRMVRAGCKQDHRFKFRDRVGDGREKRRRLHVGGGAV